MANLLVDDYLDSRHTLDEDGYYELSVLHHKTAATSGPLTIYLDTQVSVPLFNIAL